nr:retrovirus-related Pol polyprotein from transposon 17.6 [Tanacetum cinerariifolium]
RKDGSSRNAYSKLLGRGLSSIFIGVSDSDLEFSSVVIAMNSSNLENISSSRRVPSMEWRILLPSSRRASKSSSRISSITVKKRSSQDEGNFAFFFHFKNNEISRKGLRVSRDSSAYKEYGIRLTQAPRTDRGLQENILLKLYGIRNLPGSLSFGGTLFWIIVKLSSLRKVAEIPLKHLFKKQDAKPRLIRWILILQELDVEIKNKKGTENVAADHLSRIVNDESSDESSDDGVSAAEEIDQDFAHMVAASKVPMLKPGDFEIWRMRIKQYIQMMDYALWEVIENGATLLKIQVMEGVTTVIPITLVADEAQRILEALKVDLDAISMNDLYNNFKVYEPEVKGMSSSNSNIQNMAFLSITNSSTNGVVNISQAINTTNEVSAVSTQVNVVDNLSDVVICAFLASQPNSHQHAHEDLEQIHPDDMEKMDLRWQMAMLTMRAKRQKKDLTMHSWLTHFQVLTCDGLGGYDWSEQAEEGPNYALMAYTFSSSDSKSVEERLEILKKNEFIYLEDIKVLKVKIQLKDIAIKEIRRNLEVAQKEKDGTQLTIEKLKNTSKSLNKLIDCQIVDNCKKGLWYESYNAVPPPYTGNFMRLKTDLSYTGLDEFVVKPIVENKSSEEETKVVRKNTDALIIKDWVSDDEEKNMTQPKIVKKIVRPNIVKKVFVKPRQQEKTARKTVKKVEHNKQNTHRPRGNQRNWNNLMSQKLCSNFEMFNKACYVCGSFDHLQADCH